MKNLTRLRVISAFIIGLILGLVMFRQFALGTLKYNDFKEFSTSICENWQLQLIQTDFCNQVSTAKDFVEDYIIRDHIIHQYLWCGLEWTPWKFTIRCDYDYKYDLNWPHDKQL